MVGNSSWSGFQIPRRRFALLGLAATAFFVLLSLRLWYLQVIEHEFYQKQSEKNRIRYVSIDAPRGAIFDRNGKLLVANRPAFDISVLRQNKKVPEKIFEKLSPVLGVTQEELARRWQRRSHLPLYRPLPLAVDVDRDVMERIQELSCELPGVITEVRPVRSYLQGQMGAHLFGYLGEITRMELQSEAYSDYKAGSFVGKRGLERRLEKELVGVEGEKRIEVDVRGNAVRSLNIREPLPGNRIFLTIDQDIQLAGEKALQGHSGSAVAIDVNTGAVLAIISAPSFDPAKFARGVEGEEWQELVKNSRHPLQNKALQGQYPPGSTFKMVTALAALEGEVVTDHTKVNCDGGYSLGNNRYRCWKRKGHRKTDLNKALRESCDTWFYNAGLEAGIDRISETAFALGLGQKTGFFLQGEKKGLIPTREWKKKRFKDRWYAGETVIAAIGQGFVLVTPIQLAVMTAAVANGGTVWKPYVVQKIENRNGEPLLESEPQLVRKTEFNKKNIEAVHRGLISAVNHPRGTARACKLSEILVAGKTGTAQVVKRLSDEEEKAGTDGDIAWKFRDHALFVAFAPAEKPEIAVAVVVEHGEHGGSTAAPIAREMLRAYLGVEESEYVRPVGPVGD